MSSNKLNLVVDFTGQGQLGGFLKNIIGLGKKGSGALRDMKREASKLDRELTGVRKEMAAASGNVTHLVQRERELEAAMAKANRAIEGQQKGLRRIAQAEAVMRKGESYKSKGRDNVFQGAAMLAPLVYAGKAAMDFDKQMSLIAQKGELTEKQTRRVGKAFLQAARDAKQLPDVIIEGADFLTGKGLKIDVVTKMMPAIGKFGTAWDANVVDASKAAYANFLSLKVPIQDTARGLEIMAVAGMKGGFEVKDMAEHFPKLTSQMAVFGSKGLMAVGDVSAALQVLEGKTGDGAAAATNLDNMMRFVGTEQGIKKFKKYGIDIQKSLKDAVKNGRSPLEEIARLTNKATGGDNSKIGLIFSDAQAAAGARALIQDIKKYTEIRKAAMESRGMTNKEFLRMSKTSSQNWEAMKGSMAGTAVTLGTHLLPLINEGFQSVTKFVTSVSAWADANPKAAKTLLMVVGGLAGFKIALGATQFLFGSFLTSGAKLFKFFSVTNLAGVSRAARLFGVLRTAVMFLANGVMRAGILMLANPLVASIVLIGVVLAGLAYLAYKHWDTIKAAFWTAIGWMQTLPGKFRSYGSAMIAGLVNGILSAPGRVWNALKSVVMGGINGIKNFLGIKSPSRLFMQLGGHMTDGMAIGLDRGGKRPIESLKRVGRQMAVAGSMAALAPVTAGAATAGGPGAGQGAGRAGDEYHFHIKQLPGEDAEALAERIMELIKRKKGISGRSDYEDDF
jgi:TP901 family phage tail tape measure protein|tara:strand:- start:3326 stop:5524 length:2199 start_codon:yes stop_codon:yes gene_type:complete